ncbi:hypothetical protein V6N13_055056 [Hibiscus sabdariffa]|uniref:Endonuclease/exonuclease/phosphatase domain-containing protein n=1 Tax=Hibiscus sabdariffa TaxID=183260 RepID=A0ABR2DVV7_9ROSI
MEDLHVTSRFIAIVGSWVLEQWRCGVVGVYNSCMVSEQVQLWLEISSLLHLISVPWCIRGDFNIVLTGSELWGRSSTLQGTSEFNDFIVQNNLVDVVMSELKIISLPRGLSDYTPILFCNAYMESGPKPFRFLNAWTQHHDYSRDISQEWVALSADGSMDLFNKLRGL